MQGLNLEKTYFNFLLDSPQHFSKAQSDFFDNPDISLLFKIVQKFKEIYPDKVPSMEQLIYLTKKSGKDKQLTEDKIKIILEKGKEEYDRDWYQKSIESWLQFKNLEAGLINAQNYFRSKQITAENAQMICQDTVRIITEKGFITFHKKKGHSFFDINSHARPDESSRVKIGLPYFDLVTGGGISKGELWCLQGAPNVGKSIWLVNISKYLMEHGSNVLYVSLEMDWQKIMRRVGANALGITMDEYWDLMDDEDEAKQKIGEYKKSFDRNFQKLGEFDAEDFPTGSLNVPELENFLSDNIIGSGKKVDVVVIDYINIMSNWRNPNSENTYLKIKQLAEDLRAMSKRLNIAVVTATQVNRDAIDASDASMKDTSESTGLLHTVDGLFGIVQNPILKAQNKYKIKTLKNRDGGYVGTNILFDINYNLMRITQDPNAEIVS